MDSHRTPTTKTPSEPASYKTIQKAFKTYYGKLSSLRDHHDVTNLNKTDTAFNAAKKASNATDLNLNPVKVPKSAASKLRESESYLSIKKIASRTQASSPIVSPRKEVTPVKRVFRSINSSFGRDEKSSYSVDSKLKHGKQQSVAQERSVPRRDKSERPEKKQERKEEVKQEPVKPVKAQKSVKEEISKPSARKNQPVEEKKTSVLKSVYKEAEQEGGLTFTDKRKIGVYFRYKIASLGKLIREKVLGEGTGIKSERLSPRKPVFASHRYIAQKSSEKNQKDAILDEDQIIEMAWNYLKMKVSAKTKFQYQGVTNARKTIRDLIKSVLPADSAHSPKKPVNVTLSDVKKKKKKPKSPEEDKVVAFQESIHRSSLKVFIVIGGYPRIRKALKERGWIENPDKTSKVFDLKWGSRNDMEFKALCPEQSVNHFEKSITITSKVSLAWNMRNLIWQGEDIDEYFPRCYDMADINGFEDFLEDFKFEQAVSMIRLAKQNSRTGSEYRLFLLKLCIAIGFCERRLKTIEEIVLGLVRRESQMMSVEEWDILSAQSLKSILTDSKYVSLLNSVKRQYQVDFGDEEEYKTNSKEDENIFQRAEATLSRLEQATLSRLEQAFPQICMNQGKNIWIVKPAGLSRGRGISCHNSLANILDHIKIRGSEWVIQKYIENPLVIKNRKFDIRQWVLVTSWSPLTVWFYEESYVRFTAQDFNPEDVDNKFAHLTNNAITKKAANFNNSTIEGNMWDSNEFRAYLQETAGKDVFEEMIKPQMKKNVIKSLQCSLDVPETHKNSFELYGYDFMVDENYRTWLIEINSSPCMEYSTKVTERLVKMVLEDCIKVVVDYGMRDGSKKDIDTGTFKRIYKGKTNERPATKYNTFSKFY